MTDGALLIRDVEIEGRARLDVRIAGGRIVEIGEGLRGPEADLDGRGGSLLRGLIDHHIHLFALAAEGASVRVGPQASAREFERALRAKDAVLASGEWLRVVGYEDAVLGLLDRHALDRIVGERPVRVQHRSGALWVLNSAALAGVMSADAPAGVERDAAGEPTGRIWRGDDWLRARMGASPPSLAAISADLARWGVTGVADASVTNDQAQAAVFARAVREGDLTQRLMLMSGGALAAPEDGAFRVGPVKLLIDDHDLPDLGEASETIAKAHRWGRVAAIHCVTAGELAFALAAFRQPGVVSGDRIEHGGVIHPHAADEIAELGLTVITQPGFVAERGDRYLSDVDPADIPFLYPCASLIRAGIKVAGSSDAPYSSPDPWAAMRAAVSRTTRGGQALGLEERVEPRRALGLFLGDFADPGGPPRVVEVGAAADLCLLDRPLAQALAVLEPDVVAATIVGGRVIYRAA